MGGGLPCWYCNSIKHYSAQCPQNVSAAEAAVTPPDRHLDSSVTSGGRVQLPPADPWDRQQGLRHLADFAVSCSYTVKSDPYAEVHAFVDLGEQGKFELAAPALMVRTHSDLIHAEAQFLSLAWTRKVLRSGGVVVDRLDEQSPGHEYRPDGSWMFRWWAGVHGRLSVAWTLSNLDRVPSRARLVPVD